MPGGDARPARPPRRSPLSRRDRGGPRGHRADHAGRRPDGRAARRPAPRAGPATPAAEAERTAPTGRRGQRGQAAAAHLAQPAPLGLAVEGIPAPARPAGIPGGQPGAGEPGCGVAGPGVPGRVGERLDRQHDLAVQVEVVAGQPGQRPGQHRRGQHRPPAGQHAEPLLPGQHRRRPSRSASDQPITVSRAVHRSTADPYPASATQAPPSTATCRTTDPNRRAPSQ